MSIDFSKILQRAWEITWRYKFLWIFGFFAGAGGGFGGNSGSSGGNGGYGGGYNGGFSEFPAIGVVLILFVILIVLVIALVFAIMSIISRGALVGGVRQAEEEGETKLKDAWKVGLSKFWSLLGISFLTALPVIVVGIILLVVIGGLYATMGIGGVEEPAAYILPGIILGLPSCCLLVVGSIILSLIALYADRACVLEDKGWIDAFKRGWEVLRNNIANTILIGLILFVINALIGGILAVLGFGMILPGILMIASERAVAPGVAALFCLGIPIFFVAVVIGSALETFSSAVWTLAYRDITMPEAEPPAPAPQAELPSPPDVEPPAKAAEAELPPSTADAEEEVEGDEEEYTGPPE